MLIYFDESGSLHYKAKEPYYVLAAVAIEECNQKDLSKALYNLKYRHNKVFKSIYGQGIDIQDIELKGRNLLTNTVLNKANKEHFDMLNDLFQLFQAYRITTFGVIADRPYEEISFDYLSEPYIEIFMRINEFMEEFHSNSFAFCIFDEIHRKSDYVRAKNFERFIFRSKVGKCLTHIIDLISFVDSKTSSGVQLADITATTIYQQFTKNPYIGPYYLILSGLQFRKTDPDEAHLSKGIRYLYDITKKRKLDFK